MNHFSSDIPQAIWWTQEPFMEPIPHHYRRTTAASFNFNLNQDDEDELRHENLPDERERDTEPMFEKPLTPSDVGKLNRLVIPKQHAEKYFPLGPGSDSAGLLLSFEDESGKPWRFRYSYWNSSQSYVLTKGWSRFIKEKRLDAGDIVLFDRHRSDGGRLFIGWRRKPASVLAAQPGAVADNCGGGGGRRGVCYSAHAYPLHSITTHGGHGPTIPYQPDCLHAGTVLQNQTPPSGNSKTLRLFGVNLECQPDHESEPFTPDGSSTSSQGQTHYHNCTNSQTSNSQRHMDINFSRGVNHVRYHQG